MKTTVGISGLTYSSGDKLPSVKYTPTEIKTWYETNVDLTFPSVHLTI